MLEVGEYIEEIRIAEEGGFKCVECGGIIYKGEEFEIVIGDYEGDWLVYTTCMGCKELRDGVILDDYEFGTLVRRLHTCNYIKYNCVSG